MPPPLATKWLAGCRHRFLINSRHDEVVAVVGHRGGNRSLFYAQAAHKPTARSPVS